MSRVLATHWLKAAYDDIIVMNSIVTNDLVTHMTAFHAQQSVEKSLKAIKMPGNSIDLPGRYLIKSALSSILTRMK